jgi:hypothetical protein
MPNLIRRSMMLCVLLTLGACASGGASTSRPPDSRPDLIGPQELETGQWANVYDLVSSLRPRWLQSRGPDSFNKPGEVQVILDDMKFGGVSKLRSLSPSGIATLQYFDPLTAAARWGLDFGSGAIYISTRHQ